VASTPQSISVSGKGVDLSPRCASSNTVVGSPATNGATNVCQVTGLPTDTPVMTGVFLSGCVSLTVGTSGTAVTLKIRQGTTAGSGTTIASTGAITGGISAGNLISQDIQGLDAGVTGGGANASGSYFLEVTITGGAATSTVSQANLTAIVV
jgi:hypothetical protein